MVKLEYRNNMIKLNKKLFWDVKFEDLDYKKHADFLISRVLIYGDKDDYQEIKKQYSLEKIKDVAQKTIYPDKKSPNFWSLIFNIPLESFKCIKKSSTKKQSIFSQR